MQNKTHKVKKHNHKLNTYTQTNPSHTKCTGTHIDKIKNTHTHTQNKHTHIHKVKTHSQNKHKQREIETKYTTRIKHIDIHTKCTHI